MDERNTELACTVVVKVVIGLSEASEADDTVDEGVGTMLGCGVEQSLRSMTPCLMTRGTLYEAR